jgi:hypothetical protein
MALNSNALASIADTKDYLDIPISDTTQDLKIERMINTASAMIDNHCGYQIISQSYTQLFSGNNKNILFLNKSKINSITSINIDVNRIFAIDSLIASTEYIISDENSVKRYDYYWPLGNNNIKIIFTAGYTIIPSDINYACLMLIDYLYRHRNERRVGRDSISKGGDSVSFSNGLPTEIITILEPYKESFYYSAEGASSI